jgi:hypothetical protein
VAPENPLDDKCIKILFLSANPDTLGRVQFDREARRIEEKLRASKYSDAIKFTTRWAVKPDDLQQALLEVQPHIVHFSGHGTPSEEILLEADDSSPKPVTKAALAKLFAILKDNVRVVVLNACYSRAQAEAITEHIDCAVGMRKALNHDAGITFSASFYRALAFGRTIQEAFDLGRNGVEIEGLDGRDTPELLVRQGIEAGRVTLLDPGEKRSSLSQESSDQAGPTAPALLQFQTLPTSAAAPAQPNAPIAASKESKEQESHDALPASWVNEKAKDAVFVGPESGPRALPEVIWAALLSFFDLYIRRYWYSRRYLRQFIIDHRNFNTRGLLSQGAFVVQLTDVFVELRLAPNPPKEVRFDPIAAKELDGNRPIWDFLRQIAMDEAVALSIIGPPGCGKTTLLQHIGLSLAALGGRRSQKLRVSKPLFLFLRDHVAEITSASPPSLGTLAQAHFTRKHRHKPSSGWFEQQLGAGTCMVLLDGLDEVADERRRKVVAAWVDEQIRRYPRSLFAITARPLGYRTASLEQAHVLEVQPFGARQVRAFVQNWYLATEIKKSGGDDSKSVRKRADDHSNDLLQRLRQHMALSDLTRNPLLLTMIAMVHNTRKALPNRRIELFAEIYEVLFDRWQREKGLADRLTARELRDILEPFAAHMMRKQLREIHTSDALVVLRGPLTKAGLTGDALESFLPNLQAASGLLLEREHDRWCFAHLTFQEYLAVGHLRTHGAGVDWAALIQDSWWHETLRLYAAHGDATPLAKTCLELNTVPALTLLIDLLEEAPEIEESVRGEAEQRLIVNLEAQDYDLRRAAAEVHLARRLQAFHVINDQCEIDLRYVTCAEYQLFLDEMRVQGKFFQPDHWSDTRFPAGQARKPVAGVRASDASAFVKWLNIRYSAVAIYRLPTTQEAESSPAPCDQSMAAWCKEQVGSVEEEDAPGHSPRVRRRISGSAREPRERFVLAGWAPEQEAILWRQVGSLFFQCLPSSLTIMLAADTNLYDTELGFALTRALTRVPAVDTLTHIFARTLSTNLHDASALAHRIASTPADDLNKAIAMAKNFQYVHPATLALGTDLSRARARARALSINLDVALAEEREHARDVAFALEYTRQIVRKFDLVNIANTLEWGAFSEADSLIDELRNDSSPTVRNVATLVSDFLCLIQTTTLQERQEAWQRYAVALVNTLGNVDLPAVRDMSIFLQIVMARARGVISAWEGIRLARERST